MPFDSLASLLTSDYTLTIREKGFSFYTFNQSKPGTIFNRLLTEKVTDYLSPLDGMQYVNENTKVAYYYTLESLLSYKEFKCKVLLLFLEKVKRNRLVNIEIGFGKVKNTFHHIQWGQKFIGQWSSDLLSTQKFKGLDHLWSWMEFHGMGIILKEIQILKLLCTK